LDTLIGLRGNDTLDGGSSGEIGDWVKYFYFNERLIIMNALNQLLLI
jgi:hypothetical protein